MKTLQRMLWRCLALAIVAFLALQLFFLLRIATMAVLSPQSTSFERSNAYQLATAGKLRWRQEWVDYERINTSLKRAIIASEDASFTDHDGVDWQAVERAWEKNKKAEKKTSQAAKSTHAGKSAPAAKTVKTVGGSTITQQLAKNLFLSGERTYLRKAQEVVLVVMLETVLDKERIFEIYLNHVEWGTGVFGAEAAAQHYFRKPAARLDAWEGAMLAVMLPRPKVYEKVFATSEYLRSQAATVQARMNSVDIP